MPSCLFSRGHQKRDCERLKMDETQQIRNLQKMDILSIKLVSFNVSCFPIESVHYKSVMLYTTRPVILILRYSIKGSFAVKDNNSNFSNNYSEANSFVNFPRQKSSFGDKTQKSQLY
jgi:hypothetical protein